MITFQGICRFARLGRRAPLPTSNRQLSDMLSRALYVWTYGRDRPWPYTPIEGHGSEKKRLLDSGNDAQSLPLSQY